MRNNLRISLKINSAQTMISANQTKDTKNFYCVSCSKLKKKQEIQLMTFHITCFFLRLSDNSEESSLKVFKHLIGPRHSLIASARFKLKSSCTKCDKNFVLSLLEVTFQLMII